MEHNTPKLQEIAAFVEGLRFRRVPLGADLADVYACMQDLNAMYNDALEEQRSAQEAGDELGARLHEEENRAARLSAELEAARREVRSGEDAIRDLRAQLENRGSNSREQYDIIAEAIGEVVKNKETTIKADREARVIIAQAKREADELIAQARLEIDEERRQGQAYLAELDHRRMNVEQTLELIYGDLSDLNQGIHMLREKASASALSSAIADAPEEIHGLWNIEGYESA